MKCSENRIRYVDRQRYTDLRTEPIADGKNKKGEGWGRDQTPMEEKLSVVKKKVSFLESEKRRKPSGYIERGL